jgi:hypothetical protein
MPRALDKHFPSVRPDSQTFSLRAEDERKAASIAGLCDSFLRESGFSLVEVGSDYAEYRSGNDHRVRVWRHRWLCKLPGGAELSGVGFVDLSEVIRGGRISEP